MINSYKHPTAGEVKVVAPMVKLSETPAAIVRPAPLVGEHTPESLPNMAMAQPKSTTWSPAASAARRSAPDR
ncbi:hypothetical protein [Mesorhizobium tamadayense]|uniref:hypothetical protein n=1 Tax=Mesorhizobium tamadayense TaxID=425306 RepID=UPI003CCA9FCE